MADTIGVVLTLQSDPNLGLHFMIIINASAATTTTT
jgi:hypothetical protein